MIRITYETSFPMRGATRATLQLHQILRLPRKINVINDPHHIWNIISNARSNKSHPPTSPNTAPATQNESHQWSASRMKRPFQCTEQVKSPLKLTKYCACHEILRSRFQRGNPEFLPPIERRFEHIPNTIRPDDKIIISHPPLRRPFRSDLGDDFVLKNTTFRAPAISQNVTKCCACHEKSHSNITKYCACHAKLNWAVSWLSSYFTELLLDWAVTWLNCYLLSCYFTELLLDWAVAWLNCHFTELWLLNYNFTGFFAF